AEVVVAGGMENMSQAPHVIRGARVGFHLGEGKLEDSLLAALLDPYCNLYMAQTAEKLARKYEISREEQDAYALFSIRRTQDAQQQGRLAEEIFPVEIQTRRKTITVDHDDHMRPDSTLEGLAKLKPAFGKDGSVTAGNASGMVDGAAALVLAAGGSSRSGIARILGWETVGVDPSIMGIGPAPAIRGALEKVGLGLGEIDLFEINEAFAAQYLAVEKELGLDRERVNVNGGAIALGHPLGMTGTRLILTVILELRRRGARYGVASACIGGGQGMAVVVEAEKE
ncbi:MAG: acetyl-CoA C-acyltransferase, partial [Planctomycetota bacterium]